MGKRLKGGAATLIVVMVSIPFIFFGYEGITYSGDDASVLGTVEGRDLTSGEVNWQLGQYSQRIGQDLPETLISFFVQRAVEELQQRKAVASYVQETYAYAPSDAEIIRLISSQNPDIAQDGEVSALELASLAGGIGLMQDELLTLVRESMMEQYLYQRMLFSDFATARERETMDRLMRHRRDVQVLNLEAQAFSDPASHTEQEIRDYYENHLDAYEEPEKVDLSWVQWNRTVVRQRGIAVDMSQLEAVVAELREAAQGEREVLLAAIEFGAAEASLEQAQQVHAEISAGLPFEDAVRQYSTDTFSTEQGGEIGWFTHADLPESFVAAGIESLQEGAVTMPIVEGDAVYLLKVVRQRGGSQPDEDLAQQARQVLTSRAVDEAFSAGQTRLEELAYGDSTLDEIAEKLEIEVLSAQQQVLATGVTDAEVALQQPQALELVRTLVEDGEIGVLSTPLQTDAGLFIVQVDALTPPRTKDFAEVADAVRATYDREQAAQMLDDATAKVREALDALGEGDDPDLAQIAHAAGLPEDAHTVKELDGLRYDTALLSEAVATQAFLGIGAGEAGQGWVEVTDGDKRVFVRLQAVHPADPEDPAETEQIAELLQRARVQSVSSRFVQGIVAEAEVDVDMTAILASLEAGAGGGEAL